MDYPILSIAGIRFFEPIIVDLNFDAWLGKVEIIIGETNIPYSWEKPKYYKFTFFHVVEFRGFTDIRVCLEMELDRKIPYRKDEVDILFEREASDLEVDLDNSKKIIKLKNISFRDPAHSGHTWLVSEAYDRIFLFCLSYTGYIEFLYSGQIITQELSEEDSLKEWGLQWDRYEKIHSSESNINRG
ncbi:MAG: hypothetical protein OHK0012_26860 [Synechococcales cyanobacterium]